MTGQASDAAVPDAASSELPKLALVLLTDPLDTISRAVSLFLPLVPPEQVRLRVFAPAGDDCAGRAFMRNR